MGGSRLGSEWGPKRGSKGKLLSAVDVRERRQAPPPPRTSPLGAHLAAEWPRLHHVEAANRHTTRRLINAHDRETRTDAHAALHDGAAHGPRRLRRPRRRPRRSVGCQHALGVEPNVLQHGRRRRLALGLSGRATGGRWAQLARVDRARVHGTLLAALVGSAKLEAIRGVVEPASHEQVEVSRA